MQQEATVSLTRYLVAAIFCVLCIPATLAGTTDLIVVCFLVFLFVSRPGVWNTVYSVSWVWPSFFVFSP
jgi:hypothetical protein